MSRAATRLRRLLDPSSTGGCRYGRGERRVRVLCAVSQAEAQFLAIGDGAGLWLAEAAAAGTSRVRAKMAQAVQLAALHGTAAADRALGQAAAAGRFADGDLAAIVAYQASAAAGEPSRAGEASSLAQGTGGWARHGRTEAAR